MNYLDYIKSYRRFLISEKKTQPLYQLFAWEDENIPSTPSMEKVGVELFEKMLRGTQVYLEYGAGGSTVMAFTKGVPEIHSVDSDYRLLSLLEKKNQADAAKTSFRSYYADIGPTREWGFPSSMESSDKWILYASKVWWILFKNQIHPDLILIDGRFRVACFLISCFLSRIGTYILFDDYYDRKHYSIVESYIKPNQRAGRMALFKKTKQISPLSIIHIILFRKDFR